MQFIKNVIILTLFTLVSFTLAGPKYRLVSGERGVILSVDNIEKEPAVQVELIDGNLSITLPESGIDSAYSICYKLGKEYWADSLKVTNKKKDAQLTLYNFRLSIDELQKKFTTTRFLLLISPSKSVAYDKTLFVENGAVVDVAVKDIAAVYRDGFERVGISGSSLSGVKVTRNEKGILLHFVEPLKSGTAKVKLPNSYFVDSTKVVSGGDLQIYFNVKNGNYSFAEISNTKLQFFFSPTGTSASTKVMGYSAKKSYSFVLPKKVPAEQPAKSAPETNSKVLKESVIYLINDNVKVRRSPDTKSTSNVIAKFALGARFISDTKEGDWYRIKLESGETGWVGAVNALDSVSITAAQWEVIHKATGSSGKVKDKPVVDEFNSPGKKPILNEKSGGAFSLDSSNVKKVAKATPKPMVADSTKKIAQIKPYKKMGRDPFLPLSSTDFVKPKLPKVDKLTLVGVIYDPRDGIALFDEAVDSKTVSFSMRVGEKVENGKLLKIYERKVVFLMQESDFTYTIEKELLVKKE